MKEIEKTARTWLGTKFHHQGRKKHIGVDCIGFVIGVSQELGISTKDRLDYPRLPRDGQLQASLEKHLNESELEPGAIALFRIDKEPQHVGIITELDGEFGLIHAYAKARKVVEHRLDKVWRDRLVACYSLES